MSEAITVKPKVVHIIDTLRPGGAERVLVELVNGLSRKNFDAEICITRNGTELLSMLRSDIHTIVLNRLRTWDTKAIRQFADYCRQQEIKILHAHGRSSTLFAALIKGLLGNKLRLIFHDHYGAIQVNTYVPPLLKLVTKLWVDYYIGVDPFLQSWAINYLGLPPHRTSVLENAIDLKTYLLTQNSPRISFEHIKQPFVAVMVANIHRIKNHPLLIKALAKTQWARINLHVLLVGAYKNDDYFNDCQALIAQHELTSNFTFLGSRLDIPAILHSVDFGVLSSISESGPVVLLEYMASGLPFVVTETGQISSQVAQTCLDFFTPPGDVDAFANALDKMVCSSKTHLEILSQKGRELVSEMYSIDRQVDRLLEIYATLMQSGKVKN